MASTVEVAKKYFAPPKSGVALWLRQSRLPKKTSTPRNRVWLCGFDSRGCRKNFDPTKSGVALWLRLSKLPKNILPPLKSGVALWLLQSRLLKKTSTPRNQVWLCGFDCRSCRKILCPPKIGCGFVASTVEVAEKNFDPTKSVVALWL